MFDVSEKWGVLNPSKYSTLSSLSIKLGRKIIPLRLISPLFATLSFQLLEAPWLMEMSWMEFSHRNN